MNPANRRQKGLQYGLYLLMMQMVNYGIWNIPRATLIGVVAQAALYVGVIPVPWNAEEACISVANTNLRSLIMSNFEHGSDMHLYHNMISFILKGIYLEPLYKTENFTILIGLLSLGCSVMYICLAYILTVLTNDYSYYTTCAIGFSAILFALKVIVICEKPDSIAELGGIPLPSIVTVWVELILIHLLVPNASFMGHLAGILIGCLYCYTFIGITVDNMIHAITGKPIIHEYEFYGRRSRN